MTSGVVMSVVTDADCDPAMLSESARAAKATAVNRQSASVSILMANLLGFLWVEQRKHPAPSSDSRATPVLYDASMKIGILEGDDIGHEIVPAAVEVARAAARKHGLDIEWRAPPHPPKAPETHRSNAPQKNPANTP